MSTDLATDEQIEAIRRHADVFRKRGAKAAHFSLQGIEGLLHRLAMSEEALRIVSKRQGAINELREAITFFDRVKVAPENERIAVGQDHWNWLEAAARKVVAGGSHEPSA